MSYKVLYRKYRPKSFSEVAGQTAIVQTLSNALKSEKISHAYLFTGPRGTGKTTMAKLFAKAINCTKGHGEICNECDNCLAANNNTHPDIIEIDAASNNGVDEVRSIIEKVKFAPIKGKFKIYIIDEVHMMTPGAFNALLKTLEEPPSHVIFILATTEPHKVLPTILSRCQRYDFSKIDENDILDYLTQVLEKEGVKYDVNALKPIVEIADGGMRDALMMLDQVLSYTNKEIKEKDVLDLFGIASLEEKVNLLMNIANKETSKVLSKANYFIEGGVDIKRLTISLLDILKDLLIYLTTNEISLLSTIKESDIKKLEPLFNIDQVNNMINVLLKAESDFKIVSNPKSLFEITLLKLITTKTTLIEDEIVKSPSKPIATINKNVNKDNVKKEETVEDNNIKINVENNITPMAMEGESNQLDDDTMIKIMVSGNKDERMVINEKWTSSLKSLCSDPKVGKFALHLMDSCPYVITNNVLILMFDFERLAHKANIKSNQAGLSSIVEAILKRKVFIYAISKSEGAKLSKLFLNLRQINKLPDKEDIVIKED